MPKKLSNLDSMKEAALQLRRGVAKAARIATDPAVLRFARQRRHHGVSTSEGEGGLVHQPPVQYNSEALKGLSEVLRIETSLAPPFHPLDKRDRSADSDRSDHLSGKGPDEPVPLRIKAPTEPTAVESVRQMTSWPREFMT